MTAFEMLLVTVFASMTAIFASITYAGTVLKEEIKEEIRKEK